jgi:DNA-directed RNA polymerase subunit RPC12/RpoP
LFEHDRFGTPLRAVPDHASDRWGTMSKQSQREEAERLIRETMEKRNLVVKQGMTRIEAVCGKCGAPNRVQAEKGQARVKFACKNCGQKQETL